MLAKRLEIVEEGQITFYQSNVNKHKRINFQRITAGINTIKFVFDKNKDILFEKNPVIFPVQKIKRESTEKFTKSINKYLKLFTNQHNKKITINSFRVAYLTNSLKYGTAHMAQKLIGHADIRSTMKYISYEVNPKRQILF